ncbi:chorismate mutase [Streptomyces sp. KLOTTS4A1]|uniref:chorismate mutase n=1 Tax=Streptomyces sp. KLOTTS4A1 TaxID=3390996 RepID=UPI0039F5DF71
MSTPGSDRIAERSARLVSLDEEIIHLVRERTRTAAQLRMLRGLAGLREFQLARENELLSQYHEALGRPGTPIALQLLALAKAGTAGPVDPAEPLDAVPEQRMPSAA